MKIVWVLLVISKDASRRIFREVCNRFRGTAAQHMESWTTREFENLYDIIR
jgi:hypothetical protein